MILNIEDLKASPTEKYFPENTLLFELYVSSNVAQASLNIINSLDGLPHEIIVSKHSIGTFKPKPMLPYMLSYSVIPHSVAVIVSAAIDVMWNIAMLMDDMFDEDEVRDFQSAAWVKYGKQATEDASRTCFKAITKALTHTIDEHAAQNLLAQGELSYASLYKHKEMSLNTSIDELKANYIDRSAIFSAFPVITSFRAAGKLDTDMYTWSYEALHNFELAAQIGNDLQDFYYSQGGSERLSDLRNGVISYPIKLLWDELTTSGKSEQLNRFESLFGKNNLTPDDVTFIRDILALYDINKRTSQLVSQHYDRSLELMEKLMIDNHLAIAQALIASQKKRFHII